MEFVSILENGNKFDEIIKKKPSFVKFYHPSCGHCREMAPEWDALKDEFKNVKLNLNVIEVHADTLGDIKSDCAKNIPGYPTIMEVKKNGKAGKEYNGNRKVKYKTTFPKVLNIILNPVILYPFHLLQKVLTQRVSKFIDCYFW